VPDTTYRLRVTYAKAGRLRFLSHLEVTRACERAVRRAGLEYAVTQGFSPHMRIAFGPALPVGTAGLEERYDLWLKRFVPPAEVRERLTAVTPEALVPMAATYVPEREPSLSAVLTLAEYDVEVAGPAAEPGKVREALEAVLAKGELAIEHKGKTKVFDLTACLPKEPAVTSSGSGARVRVATRMGEWGSLRPEALVNEAISLLSLDARVASITRTSLLEEKRDA
jgi:radical SAM-linked protein